MEESHDVLQAGVLQVVAQANHRVVIGMCGSQRAKDSIRQLVPVGVQVLVVLLVHSLQLGMESAQHHILEAVRLNFGPVLQLVAGYILHINRLVVTGEGIAAVATDVSHQFIVLVGDEVRAGLVADAVYLVVDSLTLLWVSRCTVHFVQVGNFIQQHLLLLVVGGAQVCTTLKHHVLQIMCKTCSLHWFMLTAGMNSYECLDARLFLVDRHVNLQSIGQGIHLCVQWVVFHSLVIIFLLTARKTDDGQNS